MVSMCVPSTRFRSDSATQHEGTKKILSSGEHCYGLKSMGKDDRQPELSLLGCELILRDDTPLEHEVHVTG